MGTVQPSEILPQAGHHNDRIIAQHVSPRFENETVNDVEVIILKFGGCQMRIEENALLADRLQRIVSGLEGDERRSTGRGVVNQLTSHADGKVKGGRLEGRKAVHELLDARVTATPPVNSIRRP
jgi:hypothetical protein